MLYFIVNLKSQTGKGLSNWRAIRTILDDNGISYRGYDTKYEGHATVLASEICALPDNNKVIISVGGDGTINEILNGITDFENVRFGVIPSGSGNDFVRGHHLPADFRTALRHIIDRYNAGEDIYDRADLGRVTWEGGSKIYGISSGLGLDAIVCKRALTSRLKKLLNAFHLGNLTYILLTIHTLFSMDTCESDITYTLENDLEINQHMDKVIFSAAMNLYAEGGGVPMAPDAAGNDNVLTICSAYGIPKWRTFFCLPFLAAGRHTKIKGFDIVCAKKATIHTSKPNVLHADGEYCGDVADATFEILPGILKLL